MREAQTLMQLLQMASRRVQRPSATGGVGHDPPMLHVRPLDAGDHAWKRDTLTTTWGSTEVARLGQLVDAEALEGFVAVEDGERIGLLTFASRGDELEVVTLHSQRRRRGAGRALMDAAREAAVHQASRRLWLITTNDNVGALAFYQRWGLDLVALHREGVAASRRVKPSIPSHGHGGVPIRHELELELLLP